MMGVAQTSEIIYSTDSEFSVDEKEFKPLSMMELKPQQKRRMEALHEKVSKLGFKAKFRMVYVAKKEVYNPKKVANGFVGYMKQFASLDLNNLKPDMDYTMTTANYFDRTRRIIWRKNKIVNNYISRSWYRGINPGIYNVEELASVWHFPVEASVSAPLIEKTPVKKAKPPLSLPTEETIVYQESLEPLFSESASSLDNGAGAPPANLPFA